MNNMFISLIKRKIIIATFFITLISGTFFALPVKRTHAALFGLVDLVEVKEFVLDTIFYAINEIVIERMTQSAVNWINNGFKTDDNWSGPAFLEDPEQYLANLADEEAGVLINQYVPELCSPFSLKIKAQLELTYLQKQERPRSVRCTFSDVRQNAEQAWEEFSNDFDNGGWARWIELTARPENNAYGAYIKVENKLVGKLAERLKLEETKLSWSAGFKGVNKCYLKAVAGYDSEASLYDADALAGGTLQEVWLHPDTGTTLRPKSSPNEPAPCVDSRTVTPGTAVQDTLNEALGTSWGRLEVADEFNEIIGAFMGQLVNMAAEGLGSIAKSNKGGGNSALAAIREEIDAITGKVQEDLREYVRLKETTLDRIGSFNVIPAVLGPLESGMVKINWVGEPFEWIQTQDRTIGYTRTFGQVNRYNCNETTAQLNPGEPGKTVWTVTKDREWAWSECTLTPGDYEDEGVLLSNLNLRYSYVPIQEARNPATLVEFTNITSDSETVKVAWGEWNREIKEEFNWTAGVHYIRTGKENPISGNIDYTYKPVNCSATTEGTVAHVVDDSRVDASNNPFPIWKEVVCENVASSSTGGIYLWNERESLNFAKSVKPISRNGRFATEISWDGFFFDWDQSIIYNIGRQDSEADQPGEGVDGGLDTFPWDPRRIFDAVNPHLYQNANTCGRGGDPDKREDDRNKLEIGFAVDSIGTQKWKRYECNRQHPFNIGSDWVQDRYSYFRWKERETLDEAYLIVDFLGSEAGRVLKNGDENITRLFDQLEQCYIPAAAGNPDAQAALDTLRSRRNLRTLERAKVAHEAMVGQHFLDQIELIKSDTSQLTSSNASYNLLERLEKIQDSLENGYQTLNASEHYKQIEEENRILVDELRDCELNDFGGAGSTLPVDWDGNFFRWAYDVRYVNTGSGVQAVQSNECTAGTVGENYKVPSSQSGDVASWAWFSRTCGENTIQSGTGTSTQQTTLYEWENSNFQRMGGHPVFKSESEVLDRFGDIGVPPKVDDVPVAQNLE